VLTGMDCGARVSSGQSSRALDGLAGRATGVGRGFCLRRERGFHSAASAPGPATGLCDRTATGRSCPPRSGLAPTLAGAHPHAADASKLPFVLGNEKYGALRYPVIDKAVTG
jgi:hypothetical protein